MSAYIRNRPVPTRPMVSSRNLLDKRFAARGEEMVDLSRHKGSAIAMTVAGAVEMTNIAPDNVGRLLELRVLGAPVSSISDVIKLDPAHTRSDIYIKWALGEPKPKDLYDFDRIMEVRGLLHVPADTPHPRRFVKGAFEFLERHGCATLEEMKQLLHADTSKKDPTRKMFADISGTMQKKVSRTATLASLRAKLPAPVRTMAGTALEHPDTDEPVFAAPSPTMIGDLIHMRSLRAPGSVHLLRLSARILSPVYLTRALQGLREIDEKIEVAKTRSRRSVEEAAELVLRELIETSVDKTREGRKASTLLDTWVTMIEDLRVPIAQLDEESESILKWPSTICPELVWAHQSRRAHAAKTFRGASRLATSSGLADRLTLVIRGADARYREIESLRGLAQATRDILGSDRELTSLPIVQETAELDSEGLPTGALATHRFRLWNTQALLQSIIADRKEPLRKSSVLYRVSKGRFPETMAPTILIHEGSSGNPPWFVEMFAAGLFNPTRILPLEVRQKRYELIRDMRLPAHPTQMLDLLSYHRSDASVARTLLCEGVVAIPVEQFAIAMQLAHTAFSLAIVTAARVGEISQIRIDGANFGYDDDHGLAFWTAQPKQQSDAMDPKPLVRKYYLDDRTLAAVVSLKQTMTDLLGPDQATCPVRPSQNMNKLGDYPSLFRSREAMLDPGVIKAFLQYLTAGIASFGIHDVRAAVAKHRYDRGDSMDEIRNLLGHDGISATRGYARPTNQMIARKREERAKLSRAARRLARLDEIRRRMA